MRGNTGHCICRNSKSVDDIYSDLFVRNNYKFLLFLLTIFLSIASYKIIEKPFRNKKKVKLNFLRNYIIACVFIIISFSIYSNYSDGIKHRYNKFYVQYDNYEIDNRYLKQVWQKPLKGFYSKKPFPYAVIDNFFKTDIAHKLEKEFPDYNDKNLHEYKNYCEVKKTSNSWNLFPPLTYKIFSLLNFLL